MTEAEELELLELEEEEARSAPTAPAAASPPRVGMGETFVNSAVNAIPGGKASTDSLTALLLKAFGPGAGVGLTSQAQTDLRSRGMDVPQAYQPRTLADLYRGSRDRRLMRAALGSEQNPLASGLGTGTGIGLSLFAPLPAVGPLGKGLMMGKVLPGALTGLAYGGEAGLEHGSADLTRGEFGPAAEQAGVSALLGGALGGTLTPIVGAAAPWLGNKAQNLAGWLKVNSLHPNPTVAESMAELPGGVTGVGKTLLREGLGGFTKGGTAEQVSDVLARTSKGIDATAAALDATGAPPPDLAAVLNRSLWRDAVPMVRRPLTRATGQRLGDTLAEYQNIYEAQPGNFTEGLNFRRELDNAIFKADDFRAERDLTDFGEALRPTRRDVNTSLEEAAANASPELQAQFKDANLETRQLGYAEKAAKRVAGRTAANHLLGLRDLAAASVFPASAGAAAYASGHGGPAAILTALGSALLSKYGSQVGSRMLYELGSGLAAPRFAQSLARGPASAGAPLTLRDLLTPQRRLMLVPAYAEAR